MFKIKGRSGGFFYNSSKLLILNQITQSQNKTMWVELCDTCVCVLRVCMCVEFTMSKLL